MCVCVCVCTYIYIDICIHTPLRLAARHTALSDHARKTMFLRLTILVKLVLKVVSLYNDLQLILSLARALTLRRGYGRRARRRYSKFSHPASRKPPAPHFFSCLSFLCSSRWACGTRARRRYSERSRLSSRKPRAPQANLKFTCFASTKVQNLTQRKRPAPQVNPKCSCFTSTKALVSLVQKCKY
jgi:hypothetical protein